MSMNRAWPLVPRARAGLLAVFMGALSCTAALQAQTADDESRPDFSGIWFPNGFADRTPDPLPFTDAAQALVEEYEAEFETKDDPGRFCIWPGMPRAVWGAPFAIEIFHRDHDVTIFWEGYGMYRKIYMADSNPPEPVLPTAMGYSLAHWEDDVLVIETTDLRPYPYMDDLPTTSDARITERMYMEEREIDGEMTKVLVDEIELRDPRVYKEPIHFYAEALWRPDLHILEYTCSNTIWEDYLDEQGLTPPDIDALPEPDGGGG